MRRQLATITLAAATAAVLAAAVMPASATASGAASNRPSASGVIGSGVSLTRIVAVRDPRSGSYLAAVPGQEIHLLLTTAADGGFAWTVSRTPRSSIAALSSVTLHQHCAPMVVGCAATTLIAIRAVHYGQTSIRLRYAQPFNAAKTERFVTYSLVVHRSGSADGHPTLYVVRSGDYLWRIARNHLPAGASGATVRRLAVRLYADNHEVIGRNAATLLPGEVLLVDTTGIG